MKIDPSKFETHDGDSLWSRLGQILVIAAIVVASLGLTTTAAAFALKRPDVSVLLTETGSLLRADYSSDPHGLKVAPLDPDVIEAAASDERLLSAPSNGPQRVGIARDPTPARAAPDSGGTAAPPPASFPDATADPTDTNRPEPPVLDAPTNTPRRPASTPTNTSTNTPVRTPTDTPTKTPTRTPTDTPTRTNTPTKTGSPTATRTLTLTPPPPTPTTTRPASVTPAASATQPATVSPGLSVTPTPPGASTIFVSPAAQTVPQSGTASVDVRVDNAHDLGGYSFTLSWEGAHLTLVSVASGGFLGSTGRTVTCPPPALSDTPAVPPDNNADEAAGSVTFTCTTTGSGSGPSGPGTLATVRFGTKSPGTSGIALTGVALSSTGGAAGSPATRGGSITVNASTSTPTKTAEATVTPVLTAVTPVATDTPTHTATFTPSNTSTNTPANTPTHTPTNTATDAPTLTPSNTSTNTPANTPTNTPANTPTNTNTPVPTSTPTRTPTNTPAPPTPSPTPAPHVWVDPPTQVTSDEQVSVDIRVQDVAALGNYIITVTWDPNVLSFVEFQNGPFLGSTGRAVACLPAVTESGSATFGCTTTGSFGGPFGDGLLATVTFATIEEGESPLTLDSVTLTDIIHDPISVETKDGSVTYKAPAGTPTPTPSDTPAATSTPAPLATPTPTDTPPPPATPTPSVTPSPTPPA